MSRTVGVPFVKSVVWTIAGRVLPKSVLDKYHWRRSLAYQQRLADQIIAHYGAVVQAGPFARMRCLSDAADECIVPKLLGCYEEELSPTIEQLIPNGYDRVIDVGCASGYYVAGFALRLPNAEVFGFDIDKGALKRCRILTKMNGVDNRVTLGGWCKPQDLERLVRGRTLIIADCEGGELELLQPDLAPSLRNADIIVELHDFKNPSISTIIKRRFAETHTIETISSRARDPELYPALAVLPRAHWKGAVNERRPCPMDWAVLRSRHSR